MSAFGRDLWRVTGLASHEAYRAERTTLSAERETVRWGADKARLVVHATDAKRAIAAAARWEFQQRGHDIDPAERVTLHTATGVPVLVPAPRW